MSPFMDKQPASKTTISRMSKTLKHLSIESGLVDVWRHKFPKGRDFTFYSHRLHRIEDVNILLITVSDHTPLTLLWDIGHRPSTKQWKMNASLLNDKGFTNFISTEMRYYLDTNVSHEISPLILWDCAKAYIRGRIISFASAKKKSREAKLSELEERIRLLQQQHKKNTYPQPT